MPKAYPLEFKQAAVSRLVSGEDYTALAAELKVSVPSLYKWKKELGGNTAPAPPAQAAAPSGPPSPMTEAADNRPLSELLRDHPTEMPPPFAGGIPPVGPGPAGPTPVTKPLDPEALIAVVVVMKTIMVQTAANAWKIHLTEEDTQRIADFSEPEKKSLKMLAPYAAEYSGEMDKYAKPVMAIAFAGVATFSTISSLRTLKKLRKKEDEKKKEEKRGKRT